MDEATKVLTILDEVSNNVNAMLLTGLLGQALAIYSFYRLWRISHEHYRYC